MHLPLLPEQAAQRGGMASLPLDAMVDGVQVALKAAVATAVDLRLGGGAEH
jgi:pyroglutamyl-peptidase